MSEKQPEQVRLSGLADILKTRPSTVKYYTQLGLFPTIEQERGRHNLYDVKTCKAIYADIEKLKGKGYKVAEIMTLYAKQGKLAHEINPTVLNLATLGDNIKNINKERTN